MVVGGQTANTAPSRAPRSDDVGRSGPGIAAERRRAITGEIRRRRKARGWSQQQLADAASIGTSTIEKLESERDQGVSRRVQEAIAQAIAAEVDELFEPSQPGIPAAGRRRYSSSATQLSFDEALAIAEVSAPTLLAAIKSGAVVPLPAPRSQSRDELPEVMSPRALAEHAGVSRELASRDIRQGYLPATRGARGEWQVLRADAARYLDRPRRVAAYRFASDEVSRWKREREAAIDARTVRSSCSGCGGPIRRSRSQVHSLSGRLYCCQGCFRSHKAKLLTDEIMNTVGGCGSPTCNDPECQVPPGLCHAPGCSKPAITAPKTSRENHWVRGKPTAYCSPGHACATRNIGADDLARLRQLAQAGCTITIGVAAADMRRPPELARRYVVKFGLGSRVRGTARPGDPIRLSESDVKQMRAHVAPFDGLVFAERDAEWLSRWYQATYKKPWTPKIRGRYSKAGAKKNGTSVGQPRKWKPTEEHLRELDSCVAAGLTNAEIARKLEHKFGLTITRFDVANLRRRLNSQPT